MRSIEEYRQLRDQTVSYLQTKAKVLFITTSNRWKGEAGGELPKSTRLAIDIARRVGLEKMEIIDVTRLKIYPCEGNVSTKGGNVCGVQAAMLKDKDKNPSGYHRCYASINNPDDELWKLSKSLFQSEAVVFFGSVRWGQMNSFYQRLIERLTWIENRHFALGETNIIEHIAAGIIVTGHNWNGEQVIATQKDVLKYYGFLEAPELCWNWQFTDTIEDESLESYTQASVQFEKTFFTS